ncbi:MAG: zinc-dependent metalloprotease [Chloroflexota bacterium]|nr:zinc-dependent metalloprotease [Chloroflexota bacterium]
MTTAQRRRRAARSSRTDAALGLGLAAGAAGLALAGRYLARRARSTGHLGLVDWPRVEQLAVTRLRKVPGALTRNELAAAQDDYARAMERVVPLLEARLGQPLPGVVERHAVVDRPDWARANVTTFAALVDRIEPHLLAASGGRNSRSGLASDLAKMANRFLTTQQLGFLLGYMGARVLGQYDVALLSAEATPGNLLFVEENIRLTAAALGIKPSEFRTWIVLHEATHAFEFEANDWLRPYLRDHLERQLTGVLDQAKSIQSDGLVGLARRVRDAQDNPIAAFLSPEQRVLFEETQRVMSLLEGFSDWVMDEVGAQVLPDVAGIRSRFEARRAQRRGAFDRFVARITGLDLKLEQYRRGERFVAGVAAHGGQEAIDALWRGPASLPSDAELADPQLWVNRVVPGALARSA